MKCSETSTRDIAGKEYYLLQNMFLKDEDINILNIQMFQNITQQVNELLNTYEFAFNVEIEITIDNNRPYFIFECNHECISYRLSVGLKEVLFEYTTFDKDNSRVSKQLAILPSRMLDFQRKDMFINYITDIVNGLLLD